MGSTIFARTRRKQYLVKGQKVQQVDARELHSALGASRAEDGGSSSHAAQRSVPEAARWSARDARLAGGR
jgi:hypothetical protein